MPVNGLRTARARLRSAIPRIAFVVAILLSEVTFGAAVRVVRIDGTSVTGEWLGCPAGQRLGLRTDLGETEIELHQAAELIFSNVATNPRGTTVFHLNGGGHIVGEPLETASGGVACRMNTGGGVTIRFNDLAGVEFGYTGDPLGASELFQSAMADRSDGQDALVTRHGDRPPQILHGQLEALGPETGMFRFDNRPRTFRNEKIFGIVMAAEVVPREPSQVRVSLVAGSVIPGRLRDATADILTIETTWGHPVTIPIEDIATVDFTSDRVVYISDLTPKTQHVDGRLHRPWPVQLDRSVSGGPLSLAGQTFRKGLGVHSRTELTYELGNEFDTFLATIGIDDAVRPRGSVCFRVRGDGRTLFDSGELTGLDDPRELAVDISGVSVLTLEVDFGEGLDLADHADWGQARLLKAAVIPYHEPSNGIGSDR